MKHKTILIVDDDDDDQLVFKEAIDEIGAELSCVLAYSGREALAYLEGASELPTIIFLDLNMPLMNGMELLERIRADKRFRHIPVVIISTSSNPKDKAQADALEAQLFFTKTANFKVLKSTLASILQTHFPNE